VTIEEAWRRAKEAIPKGWVIWIAELDTEAYYHNRFRAIARVPFIFPDSPREVVVYGDTMQQALQRLAEHYA
jgi:hypothetical protein